MINRAPSATPGGTCTVMASASSCRWEPAQAGHGGLGVVSAGIAEALVATAAGLLVAIPALWLFNYLTQQIAGLGTEMECVAEELAVTAAMEGRRDGVFDG